MLILVFTSVSFKYVAQMLISRNINGKWCYQSLEFHRKSGLFDYHISYRLYPYNIICTFIDTQSKYLL